jgi:hypothetical protein
MGRVNINGAVDFAGALSQRKIGIWPGMDMIYHVASSQEQIYDSGLRY